MKNKQIRFIVFCLILLFVVIMFRNLSTSAVNNGSQSAAISRGSSSWWSNLLSGFLSPSNNSRSSDTSTSLTLCLNDSYHTCPPRNVPQWGADPNAIDPSYPDLPNDGCSNHQVREGELDYYGRAICKSNLGQCPPNYDYFAGQSQFINISCATFDCRCQRRTTGTVSPVQEQIAPGSN